jgi:formylglycine-generating enzyme required for sulfatase activity
MNAFQESFEILSVNHRGEIISRRQGRATCYHENLGGGETLSMVAIPGGAFQMGSPPGAGYPDEHPQHLVQIQPFLLGKYPLTQGQWQAVMRKKPPFRFEDEHKPVENVSWQDAREFCQRLARKTGRDYRLPSEAEWEYACRAGTVTPFSFGEAITTDLVNYCGDHTYSSAPKGIYRHHTTQPGLFPPNAFGLYDMHGNVWEWCLDAWHDGYHGAPADGSAWEGEGNIGERVLRGGSWHEPPDHCRSALRLKLEPEEKDDVFGFRVALPNLT